MKINLPSEIGDGRLDTILEIFALLQSPKVKSLQLNWQNTTMISPAGFAVLACLFDRCLEQEKNIQNIFVKQRLKENPVVLNLLQLKKFKTLPKPHVHEFSNNTFILGAGEKSLNISFVENFRYIFENSLSDDLSFSCQLVLNELMQNSVDHSTSERYYLYSGVWQKSMHVGVLDMGCSIPAKLQQKYICENDVDYLALSCEEGISTRRQRQGGLGLSHTFDLLKDHNGTLTLLSRDAQIRRYFKNRVVQRALLKNTLRGTWCFARFPLEKKS